MIYLEKRKFDNKKIFNGTGKEALIYLIDDVIYKVYRNKFPYIDEKVSFFKNLEIEHVALLKDVLVDNIPYGYIMEHMQGKAIYPTLNCSIECITEASKNLPITIKNISNCHLTPTDINIGSILLNTNKNVFEIVDTYGYVIYKNLSSEKIYHHNIKRFNDTVLCGILSQDWKELIYNIFLQYNPEYIKYIKKSDNELLAYEIISILQDILDCESLESMKQKIKKKRY